MYRCSFPVLLAGLLGAVLLHLPGGIGAAQIPPDKAVITLEPKFGPVRFSHLRHSGAAGVACRDCHHTMTDEGPSHGCHGCHSSSNYRIAEIRPAEASAPASQSAAKPITAKQAFHGLCKGCHARLGRQGLPSGPSDSCRDCHK